MVDTDDLSRYERFTQGNLTLIARVDLMTAFIHAAMTRSIHAWAAAQAGRREFEGRLPAYAVRLPFDGPAVVVRHNHHGGWLARLRGDRFFLPRAFHELSLSRLLRQAGISTPEVLGVAVYRINWYSRSSDVVTAELPPGRDFGTLLREETTGDERRAAWTAVAALLHALAAVGAWHADLNVKNIHLSNAGDAWTASVLDVDRIRLGEPGLIVAKANRTRLLRSLDKWERLYGVRITAAERALLDVAEAAP